MSLDMDPAVRDQWCRALRSGEYQQTIGQLRDGSAYCCLGVLTDLAAEAGVFSWDALDDTHYGVLPEAVQDWAGLASEDPSLIFEPHEWISASGANDMGKSFAEIADLIDTGRPEAGEAA
jgi:hypothetical protein